MQRSINKTTLKNGVRIVTRKIPYVRSVSMGVWVNVGARDETLAQSGLSHFIEHMIFKGTTRRDAYEIAKEFDAIGGNTNAFTGMETTCYHARVVDAHMETMVDILTDIFLNSVFDEKEVEKERPVILQEIGMVEDSPEEYVHMLSEKVFWGDDPLGRPIIGTRENVAGFDAATIKAFFHKLYQPDRIVISLAGNVDHEKFLDLAGPAFESIRTGDALPARTTPEGRRNISLNNRDLEQVHICLETPGIGITDPARYTLSLLSTILGGNMSSILFQEIREQRGLAYSVYSFISSYTDTGAFGVYTGVDPAKAEETISLILSKMKGLKESRVSEEALQHAKEYTKGCVLLASESTDNQMVRLSQNEIHFGTYIPVGEVIKKINAVTPDEIMELANKLLRDESLTLTMLGSIPFDKSNVDFLSFS